MKRTTFLLSGATLLLCIIEPTLVHAATTSPFFGPIIDPVCNCDPIGGVSGNGITVPTSAPAWGCVLETFQRAMNFLISFATVIITIFIAWAGFTYMVSGGNPEKRSLANKRIMNAVIGLIIVLCAYLVVDSLMKIIYNPSAPNLGPWNSILAGDGAGTCLAPVPNGKPLPGTTAATNPSAAPAPAQQSASPVSSGGPIEANICNAANAYHGQPTTACNCGGSACAWAVNNVLTNAGLQPMGGSSVLAMQSALTGGRGTAISQGDAVCGDLVIVTNGSGENHVGVCMTNGCTSALSNSSTNHSFTWVSSTNPVFGESYSLSYPRYYYRVTN
jgi:Type IV secretion system pilin